MVLLQLLHRLARKHSWRLHVAHLNHGLRGKASEADERLVVQEARRLDLPVTVERVAIRDIARARKVSVEMAARDVRHEFLARTALRLGMRSVALAQHADDQVELFFLRLLRGSGPDGLGGMRWRRPSPAGREVELVRPLLDVAKSELRAWAKDQQVRFREDSSNASLDYQRNRIRHELLPRLRRQFQPALERVVSRLMDLARADGDLLDAQARQFLASTRATFRRLPTALQRRCVQLELQQAGIRPEFELVEQLRTAEGKRVSVAKSKSVSLTSRGRLRVWSTADALERIEARTLKESRVKLGATSGRGSFGGLKFRWRLGPGRGKSLSKKRTQNEYFDADAVGEGMLLRHWRAGDRMQPIGMKSAVKLQDLFTNLKIPRDERHQLVILTTRRGQIIWVEGLRISERFKLSDATNRHLHWQWKRL